MRVDLRRVICTRSRDTNLGQFRYLENAWVWIWTGPPYFYQGVKLLKFTSLFSQKVIFKIG